MINEMLGKIIIRKSSKYIGGTILTSLIQAIVLNLLGVSLLLSFYVLSSINASLLVIYKIGMHLFSLKKNDVEVLSKRTEEDSKLDSFKSEVNDTLGNVHMVFDEFLTFSSDIADSSKKQTESSNNLNLMTSELSSYLISMTADSEQISNSISGQASDITHLSESTNKILERCSSEADIALSAVKKAEETSENIVALEEAADKIGGVVVSISDIAKLTSLLALNATIEAATAGEAGRGFAVVANEVKELAKQTAVATTEISNSVKDIQEIATNSVTSIKEVSKVINEVGEISDQIVLLVKEQNEMTTKISNEMQSSSGKVNKISENISMKKE